MERILISACLLGQPVRYDGRAKAQSHPAIERWRAEGRLLVLCPEVAGGLPVPRPPAELQGGQVIASSGQDVTAAFRLGADQALALCRRHQIRFALLKANSPSCGNVQIYDGSFSGRLIDGQGVTARLLTENGVRVYSELQLDELAAALDEFEQA
ncbi:DUF523 domain-containing protein [Gallaecimonas sp. GXIMD4217]|uniref:DUF523 domain-containing protein n=1 Tax=Gallaecimonas sp. GXIMD4217 TaxID=3131927 RepID=UPI00311B2C6F